MRLCLHWQVCFIENLIGNNGRKSQLSLALKNKDIMERKTMIKDITKIEIEGGIFDTKTEFDFFNPHEEKKEKTIKGTLLYGRNGSGKSTIAKSFRKLAGESVPTIINATAYGVENQSLILAEKEKKQIFVFDEDYVDKNVRLQQDHLDTIVMLGQAADLTDKIEKVTLERDAAKRALEEQSMVCQEFLNISNVKSPKYHKNLILNALKGDDNWAGRDREIQGNRLNTGVREDKYLKFLSLKPMKSKTELISDYKNKIKELKALREGTTVINQKVPTLSNIYQTYNDEAVAQILAEIIEKPELSEREKRLFELLQKGTTEDLSERLEYLKKDNIVECPYCFQTITVEHRESLVKSIEKVLNKITKEHQRKIRILILNEVNIDLSFFIKLNNYQKCIDLITKINNAIEENNVNLKKKYYNPYEPIVVESSEIKNMAHQLKTVLFELEKERIEFNNVSKKIDILVNELNRINAEIAYYDVVKLSASYNKQEKIYKKEQEKLNILSNNYQEREKEVESLQAQRCNVRLAINSINACLKYIFFSEDRLKIEYSNGVYKLLSNGKSVKPCDVSVGERNIIALSYFFTSILEGREEKYAYNEEYLLIIDDPVSSYDFENRIGILSFLKYKLSVFLEGNINTKALVMTHDLKTFYDIHKVFEEIINACKEAGYQDSKFNRFEMREKKLNPFYNKRQEYTEIVETIYNYAIGEADSYEFVIGNMMRQALEAFSTFEYKKGIEDISTNEQILEMLHEKEYVSYFKNLMYRLVLHGGSHKEEQVKTMNDFDFFSVISEDEKKRTAKDVLCFVYLLNKRHLLEHLKKIKNIESVIQTWCMDIKKRAAVI